MGLTDMKFLGTSASFLTVVAQVPGGSHRWLLCSRVLVGPLWSRAEEPAPAAFIAEYKEATGEDPVGFSMLGYSAAEMMVKALEAAGPDLSHESFIAAMESLDYEDELVGNQITYGPDDHQGCGHRVCQRRRKWRMEAGLRRINPPKKKGSQLRALSNSVFVAINAWRTGTNDALCAYRISYVPQRGCRGSGSQRLSVRHAGLGSYSCSAFEMPCLTAPA